MVPSPSEADSHWVRWHQPYEDPASGLSLRLRLVQSAVREVLNGAPPGPIRVISMCAGQGRDLIDVVAGHPRAADVSAQLVEQDPALVAFARDRAAAAGVGDRFAVVEGDASLSRHYVDAIPADLVLVCGVFGNLVDEGVAALVAALPSFCAPGANVIWTRHRHPPDLTPAIREWFGSAGFAEVSCEAPPDPYVMTVGRERLGATPRVKFDPGARLFDFIGDGGLPV